MTKKEFIKIVKAMEYFADTEIVKEIRNTRNYNIKIYQNYCSEEDIKHLAITAKYNKQIIKEDWFKELSAKEIIDLAKNYKTIYGSLYTLIYCFYMNDYKRRIGLIEFTPDEENWYKKEFAKKKEILITEL